MASQNISKQNEFKHKLSSVNFPELIFAIKSSRLKFDSVEGSFKQISNEDPFYKKPNESIQLASEEEKLEEDIENKKKKKLQINEKLKEINKKFEIMHKVLQVDLNEKDYLVDLKSQCGNMKYKDLFQDEEIKEI